MPLDTTLPEESACAFGSDCRLVGVYTAATKESADDTPCALFLTAGLLHHVGPARLHVELARTLAQQGVPGLRFDLSGVGDSEPSCLGGSFAERSVQEVREAMNHLHAEYGHQRFVLVGLCSGADDALATALQDARVAGIVLLNGYAYPAGHFRMHRFLRFYLPRLFMWEKLRNRSTAMLRRAMALLGKPSEPSEGGLSKEDRDALADLDDDYRYIPEQKQTEAMLTRLCEEHTEVSFIFTGSEHDTYTYEGQLKAMFPALSDSPHLSEFYLAEADHTVILKEDRDKLIQWISAWFKHALFRRGLPLS